MLKYFVDFSTIGFFYLKEPLNSYNISQHCCKIFDTQEKIKNIFTPYFFQSCVNSKHVWNIRLYLHNTQMCEASVWNGFYHFESHAYFVICSQICKVKDWLIFMTFCAVRIHFAKVSFTKVLFIYNEFGKSWDGTFMPHKRNGQWKNPPTHKQPMAVSRGKLSMDVTPKVPSEIKRIKNNFLLNHGVAIGLKWRENVFF